MYFFCLWPVAGLAAQTATPTVSPSPAATASPSPTPTLNSAVKDKWQLGFTALKDRQLSQENKYLCYSLPLILKQSLQTISTHQLNEEEKTIYRRKQLNVELVDLQTKLDNQKLTRDKKFFDKAIRRPAELDTRADEKQRDELVRQINETASKDPSAIPIRDEVAVEMKIYKENDPLFVLPFFSLMEFAKKNTLDLVIWGEIEEIQNYLYLRIMLFNTLEEKDVVDFEYASAPDKIYDVIPGIIDKLAAHILGRSWAALTVNPEPATCTVEINGVLKGLGQVADPFIEPGKYQVKVMHAGYKTHEETFSLAPGEKKELIVKLEETGMKTFFVDTNPPEAAIYLNSLWQGQSPLELHIDELPQSLIIKKEGYRDLRAELEADSPEQLQYALRKNIYDLSKRQQKKRDDFYRSLGFFALSLPVPFICYYIYEDIAAVNLNTGTGEYRSQASAFYYAYAGGIFLTVSLAINMLINLADYIKATDNLQEN